MSEQNDPAAMDTMLANLLSGLEKLPGYDGITFRGRTTNSRFGGQGQVLVSTGLVATSRDVRVATENFTTAGLYAVIGKAGRAIEQLSQHPEEREVVFLPSTLFLVVKSARVGDLPVTVVEQLDPHRDPSAPKERPIDEWAPLIAASVQKARERPDVAITSPGKFAGDIE